MNLENSITFALQWSLALLAVAAAWGALVYARRLVLARLEARRKVPALLLRKPGDGRLKHLALTPEQVRESPRA